MTEPDFPYKKPPPENPAVREKGTQSSPDVTEPKIEEESTKGNEGKVKEAGTFTCSVCGKSFNTQSELDLHTSTAHKTAKKVTV